MGGGIGGGPRENEEKGDRRICFSFQTFIILSIIPNTPYRITSSSFFFGAVLSITLATYMFSYLPVPRHALFTQSQYIYPVIMSLRFQKRMRLGLDPSSPQQERCTSAKVLCIEHYRETAFAV